ncbi:MAG: hypothetical protein ACXACP_09820 [Candidatus Hodarchaeales archaeon]
MKQNLIALAGLSHSGKDLLFSHFIKLGRSEPKLKILENLIYYDWFSNPFKKREDSYLEKFLPVISEKVFSKINTLIYVHDISYQRLDDIETDFNQIFSTIHAINKKFQVVVLVNRGHLIPNELERTKIQKNVVATLQKIVPTEISTYIVSLKGSDQQRTANLIITQIINKAVDFQEEVKKLITQTPKKIHGRKESKIKSVLKEKMEECGFAGAYVVDAQNIQLAVGKSEGWEKKVGPQIVRMLAQYNVFDLGLNYQADIIRIEDFVMATKRINEDLSFIMIGREANFKYNNEPFPVIEQNCQEITNQILEILK